MESTMPMNGHASSASASPTTASDGAARIDPHVRIRPGSTWSVLNVTELWRYRDLLLALSARDVKLRYKQTALGVAWVLLQPLLGAGVFSFVFGKIAKMPSNGIPYFLFSYAGLLGWNLFNTSVTRSSSSLIGNSHLISKVYFPRMLLPLSAIPSALIDFVVAGVVMAVLLVVNHISVGPHLLTLPIWCLLLMLLSAGIGLWTAALSVTYRDVQFIVPVVLQLLLYGSPVAYAASAVPARLQTFYKLNPLVAILEGFRYSMLPTGDLDRYSTLYATAVCVVIFFAGTLVFSRMERKFADVI